MSGRWSFWIDRGGTFTDLIALSPDGRLHTHKTLSSDSAPVEGVKFLLRAHSDWVDERPLPPCDLKIGTTLATNALLERRGVPCVLAINRGFGDLVEIGSQQRPELFELEIKKPAPLYALTMELAGRIDAAGAELEPFDEADATRRLRRAYDAGLRSIAIAGLHAYLDATWEERAARLAREVGFEYVVTSAAVASEIGMLARAETALLDAYLTPLLRAHTAQIAEAAPRARVRFMQSSGGLTKAAGFRGQRALLSGPAGGAVGAGRVAAEAGHRRAIGFDMGGTSTDISLIVDGKTERAFETQVAGLRARTPMLRIHTVAAGGGSLCRFDGFRFSVGPESAGAQPGPLCYGDPAASELALTDINCFLGRFQAERFPLALHPERVKTALDELCARLAQAGLRRSPEAVAAGFVEIANAHMAQAIAKVSIERGVDPRECALVGFGGAAGQHVCNVARQLGMKQILLHPLAGLLSAYGIGVAELTWERQSDAGRGELAADGQPAQGARVALRRLERDLNAELADEGVQPETARFERFLDLRYVGAETALNIAEPPDGDWLKAFLAAHQERFGYTRRQRAVEALNARVRATAAEPELTRRARQPAAQPSARGAKPEPLSWSSVWFAETGRVNTPLYRREDLRAGDELNGPAVILESGATTLVDPEFSARLDDNGVLTLTDLQSEGRKTQTRRATAYDLPQLREADPVRLEVTGNRFMSIAEQMGATLQKTAISTNIKDRLDYSCAVFDANGGLVANAPHIPVHLGAMGATVRSVIREIGDLRAGDAIVTNDPNRGGSHLPDITLATPVFIDGKLRFFVASRGHQEDIGGITPGSMPAHARNLNEEGVVIKPFPLLRDGVFNEKRLRQTLADAPYPARNPDDNVADLEAMAAANRAGEAALNQMASELGMEQIAVTMRQLQDAAQAKVEAELAKLGDGSLTFRDEFDDGTPICVRVDLRGGKMTVDFSGTGKARPDSNLNAPRAVVDSAIIYVLRCLVREKIPLNSGSLAPITIKTPPGSLLNPPPDVAVCGGNVETSQRIVETLLGALGLAAASQGTMNNLTFGDERFGYYETIAGGAGAGDGFDGASGVHTHMTNTRITDVEVMETRMPVIIRRFGLRSGSGGAGKWRGGDGVAREFEFTKPLEVALLTERRRVAPWGMAGGEPAKCGRNTLIRQNGERQTLPHRAAVKLNPGDRILIETPGGGGFDKAP